MDDLFEIVGGLIAFFGGIFVVLVMPIMSILNWRRVTRLQGEVLSLRQQLSGLRKGPVAAEAAQPVAATAPAEPVRVEPVSAPPPVEPIVPEPITPPPPAAETMMPSPVADQPADIAALPLPPKKDFEGRLGGRIYGWLGGIALALAGIFLVKHSIEQGWLSPTVRVGLGILFGFVLLGVAQWMRKQSNNLGQALSAASVAVLYASLFAGVALYDLIPPVLAFVTLAALTFAAIGLALRDGPFVGIVGLAGGFLTPAFVSSDDPNVPVLFGFLYLLQLGALVLLKKRGWWYQAAIANGGGLLWAFLGAMTIGGDPTVGGAFALPLFLIATSWTCVWALQSQGGVARSAHMLWTTRATSILCFLVMAAWLGSNEHELVDWFFALVLVFSHLVAARRWTAEDVPAYLGTAIIIVAYALWWPFGWAPPSEIIPNSQIVDRTLEMIGVGLIFGGALLFGGWYFIHGAAKPTRWAALSALGSAFVFGGAYWQLRDTEITISWPIIAIILAAIHFGLAQRLDALRRAEPRYVDAFAIHCLAVSGFIAIAIPMQLEEAWISVAWSLELPIVAWVANRLDIAWLRRAIWVGGGLVIFGILWSGQVFSTWAAGDTLIFNWLLYGLGIPLLSFVVTSYQLTATPEQVLRKALQLGAAILGFILLALEIEHFFYHIDVPDPAYMIHGVQALAWLLVSHALLVIGDRRQAPILHQAAMVIAGIASLWLLIYPLILELPLWANISVGTVPFFNRIGLIYGGAALLLLGLGWALMRRPLLGQMASIGYRAAGAYGLFLGFVCVSLWVRQLVHGDNINLFGRAVTDGELYGYSAAWTLYGVALLGLGVKMRTQALRYASAAVVMLTVLKVGLIDASDLTGLYRVASFLGLGVALIGIGYLYQRILFRKEA
ncbi:DUF2339 domain-containing protein [Dongia sp.]|uniref:DUF2339 domain-containing protein n=1 Tax=Dongia sp. TaxID=1977262 RepID=UPI0035B4ED8D